MFLMLYLLVSCHSGTFPGDFHWLGGFRHRLFLLWPLSHHKELEVWLRTWSSASKLQDLPGIQVVPKNNSHFLFSHPVITSSLWTAPAPLHLVFCHLKWHICHEVSWISSSRDSFPLKIPKSLVLSTTPYESFWTSPINAIYKCHLL